ncbi:MAG TPA: TonB-dependent receptor [Candidatus Acidoferrales bacterium]|nr:TonB-dependent receptor [Candidatus Acidoferrales bacterium]
MIRATEFLALLVVVAGSAFAGEAQLAGRVLDPQGRPVPGATVRLLAGTVETARSPTDDRGQYRIAVAGPGPYRLAAEAPGFQSGAREVTVAAGEIQAVDLTLAGIAGQHQSVVISAKTVEPALDLRNSEVFNRTLFTRDDQVMQQLNAGIDAGQHEGGGKSLEIRRFGFNLDHGGVNGGLKVLVDDVQQNQGTQGHGQGYLGGLKALSPELIQDVTIINGPFSAEYGDFSGLGVVHIRQRESLPDEFTLRLQGGNFNTGRGFFAYSPELQHADAYAAYEGSYTDGPFQNPLRYRRDNVNANYTASIGKDEKLGVRVLFGRNDFYSSGQIPLDLVAAGTLDRFGYVDPSDGGRVRLGTASAYYSKLLSNGDTFKADGFLSRSLFDLYSNFTYYLNDPVNGDAFQQHDSRLQQGLNAQYTHPHHLGPFAAVLVGGANFHDNEINVGLYPRDGRNPAGVTTRADAHVTNGAGYAQESLSLMRGRLLLSGGIRFDEFRFDVADRVNPDQSGVQAAGRWQGKGSVAFTPSHSVPLTLTANYGRGINSIDARGVVQRPGEPRLATTDFYQVGTSSNFGRFGISTDAFWIDHSNEQVYIPDDGSFEFKGPSRAYGYEAKASVAITRWLSLNGGMTKIGNSFFRGGDHRVYVDSAPHFVANAALTVAAWHGWSGSLRMRAINHYRLDGDDPSIVASGHTVFDMGLARQIRRGVELNLSLDNLTNRDYWETQNYFESQVSPDAPPVWRIHGTPGYPLTAVAGITFRLRGK